MDFIWFVFSLLFRSIIYNHPRCHIKFFNDNTNVFRFYFYSYAHHLPRAGQTIKGKKFETGYGGKLCEWLCDCSIKQIYNDWKKKQIWCKNLIFLLRDNFDLWLKWPNMKHFTAWPMRIVVLSFVRVTVYTGIFNKLQTGRSFENNNRFMFKQKINETRNSAMIFPLLKSGFVTKF